MPETMSSLLRAEALYTVYTYLFICFKSSGKGLMTEERMTNTNTKKVTIKGNRAGKWRGSVKRDGLEGEMYASNPNPKRYQHSVSCRNF